MTDTKSSESLPRLADEQAALRRVATLVAQDTAPAEIFAAVSVEVDRVFGLDPATLDVAGVVRCEPGPEFLVVGVSRSVEAVPLGARFQLDDLFAPTHVLRTGRSARIVEDDLASVGGETADFLRHHGYLSQVASPIVVNGHSWGAISVNSSIEFPPDTEERLERFTELVATAIANAESREALAQLADEQAALRRVATLAAQGVQPHELFAVVAEEVGRVVEAPLVSVARYEGDDSVRIFGTFPLEGPLFRTGSRISLEGVSVLGRIRAGGEPARIDDYTGLEGEIAHRARTNAIRSGAGVPIVVAGHVWGAIVAWSHERLPDDFEARLDEFTKLLAAAIGNAEATESLALLADEQAALRRVAMLVAEEAAPDRIFAAVCEQVGQLLEADHTALETFPGDGTATLIAAWSKDGPPVPVGKQFALEPDTIAARIASTHAPARRDPYDDGNIQVGPIGRALDLQATVGASILVGGRLWGALLAGTRRSDPWAEQAEIRLAGFTELVATAITNAESRDARFRLAEEQAALRRVATLVARDSPPGEVFDAVAMEVGTLLNTDITVVGRYDGDGAATAIGSWSSSPVKVPVGTRSVVGGNNVLTLVAETAKPARIDGYDDASGEASEIAREHGWSSSIAAPIIVEDRLWGVMLVATQSPDPFPEGAEERLAAFTDLVATALANAQAHDEVRRFGEEQAALGRVATLVAAGAAPERVFAAVVDEASRLLALERIELVRYDGDDRGTVIASTGDHPFPAGSSWPLDDPSVMATVARTRRPARMDDYTNVEGEIAEAARAGGFNSAIGAPVTVEGRLWGVIIAISTDPEPIPERSEVRLGQFTELVATAVANAEARDALAQLADEQAALRRVATLVAQGVEPEVIFSAVGEEIGRLLGTSMSAVGRFESGADGATLMIVGVGVGDTIETGSRWSPDDLLPVARVFRTERSVRIDEMDWSTGGPVAEVARQAGVVSIVASPIFVEGRLWGVMTACDTKRLPPEAGERLEKFSELVATSIGNAESSAELSASRRRIVAAADEARRRIQRDLHDGMQQRLVSLGFALRSAQANLPPEQDDLRYQLSHVAAGLKAAVEDLQEISRGIHPVILSKGGLGPAFRVLARRSAIPVDLALATDARFGEPIEVAAYYVASEALANAAKHSQASRIDISLDQRDGRLALSIGDNGVGGADASRGSGLIGLTDRIDALGGTIAIHSSAGKGTCIIVTLPIAPKPDQKTESYLGP